MTRRHPASALVAGFQLIVRLYPWSVLWILFAVGLALLVTATWLPCLVVLTMILAVIGQWLYRERDDYRRGHR